MEFVSAPCVLRAQRAPHVAAVLADLGRGYSRRPPVDFAFAPAVDRLWANAGARCVALHELSIAAGSHGPVHGPAHYAARCIDSAAQMKPASSRATAVFTFDGGIPRSRSR